MKTKQMLCVSKVAAFAHILMAQEIGSGEL